MKKLLGATALTLIAGAAAAQQAPTTVSSSNFNARIGGFMTLGLGYVDSDAHKAEVEIVNNSEVIFNFTLTADNGLTFFAKAEIENNGGPTTSDEYVGGVRGFFGTIEVGAEDGAADRLRYATPSSAFTNVVDGTGLLFDYASGESPADLGYNGDTGDDLKVTYFTPRFAGFQAAVSYANGAEGPTSTDGAEGAREGFELGANYENTFGDFSVSAGAGYVSISSPRNRDFEDSYSIGGGVGFAGFEVGVGYFVTNNVGADDTEVLGAGVTYATGPWNFGLNYGVSFGGENEDDYGLGAGVDYALAPGVLVGGIVEYADGKAFDRAAGSEDAYSAGLFMALNF